MLSQAQRKQIASLTSSELARLADKLEAETRTRGFFVRFAAVEFIREIRIAAKRASLTEGAR